MGDGGQMEGSRREGLAKSHCVPAHPLLGLFKFARRIALQQLSA